MATVIKDIITIALALTGAFLCVVPGAIVYLFMYNGWLPGLALIISGVVVFVMLLSTRMGERRRISEGKRWEGWRR